MGKKETILARIDKAAREILDDQPLPSLTITQTLKGAQSWATVPTW